jgi:hypothetical protein
MATIRQIVPSSSISEFRPVRQEGGRGFRALAGAMDVAYEALKPAAIDQMTKAGDALGRDMAKQQIGATAPVVTASTKNPADPNAALASDAMTALGKGSTRYRDAIASIESAGSGDYAAVGPTNAKLGRALGRYQIMEANIGPWSREVLGREVSANEFLANPDIQDAIFDHKFGGYVQRFGEEGAAQAWFAGEGGVGQTGRSDVLGTTVGGYGQKFTAALAGNVTASTMDGAPAAPTVLRDADGKLTSRLFGPTSNPIMAAHDAAAGAAWQSEVFLKAGPDFMSMSEQFALNPEGFKQASDEYVTAMVEQAPEAFKMDVRDNLEKEASRRFLGLIDEKHSDIRQRANNSTSALADKWADDLASAIATGNPEEIAAARSELQSVLAVRERLPGLSWTPEQSVNYMGSAEQEGQRRIAAAADEQKAGWKTSLSGITDAAKLGLTSADETLLDNPMVQQMLPEEWKRAAAFTTLRDQLPTFNAMPPSQQAAALAEMAKQPVTSPVETEIYGAAKETAAANAMAWIDDPIKRAGEVLTDDPPPVLPEFDINNPDGFTAALTARADYAQRLVDGEYIKSPTYITDDEAKAIGAVFGKGVPPEIKAAAAGAIVGAMGDDAAGFFAQISTTDPVIPHVGALLARGGSTTIATEAMTGQALLDEKAVQAPTASAVSEGMKGVKDALEATPGAMGSIKALTDTARAIYAARISAGADEQTQKSVMADAWQAALGQSTKLGRTVGGVQNVGGRPVLLPPTMSGADLTQAMDKAFGLETASGIAGLFGTKDWVSNDPAMWMAAAGGVPALGGQPINPSAWRNGEMTLTPVGGSKYRLSVTRNGVVIDIGVQGQADDVPFIFDAELLLKASLVP